MPLPLRSFLLVPALVATCFADASVWAPGFNFQPFPFSDATDSGHCGKAANPQATLGTVKFAQTHLMEPSWPFFYLAGERPALIAVALQGTGAAPDVRITASVEGIEVGTACLSGPAEIPPSGSDSIPSESSLYTMVLPKEWVRKGLSLVVEAGSDRRSYTAAQLQVSPRTEINILTADMQVLDHVPYPQGWHQRPADSLAKFAAAFPASLTRFGHIPGRMVFDRLVVGNGSFEPLLVCGEAVQDRTGCSRDSSAYAAKQVITLIRFAQALGYATGMIQSGGFLSAYTMNFFDGGGRGGGQVATSFDFNGNMLHELGHALGLQHWDEFYGVRSPSMFAFSYPYGGEDSDGGGRGPSWNWEANTREFISPRCSEPEDPNFGKERPDEMSNSWNWCWEHRKDGSEPWVGYGDFSARAILDNLLGLGDSVVGKVPYKGDSAAYRRPHQAGLPTLVRGTDGKLGLVRDPTQPEGHNTGERYPFLLPVALDTPVYLVFGSYLPSSPKANVIYQPLSYRGPMPRLIDPTDSSDFADLKAFPRGTMGLHFFARTFDITLRFTYADGTVRTVLYPYDYPYRPATTDLSGFRTDLVHWVIAVPADKKLSKVQVFRRPMTVMDTGDTVTGNLLRTGSTITAANFMDDAVLISERTFTDVVPPTGIVLRAPTSGELERLGGEVAVRSLDGRIIRSFVLEPNASLERRTRQEMHGRGIWLVQLKNARGGLSRLVAVQ